MKIYADEYITEHLYNNIDNFNNLDEIEYWNENNDDLNEYIDEDIGIVKSISMKSINNIIVKKTSIELIKTLDLLEKIEMIEKFGDLMKKNNAIFNFIYNKYDYEFKRTTILIMYFYIKNLIKTHNSIRLQYYYKINTRYLNWLKYELI